MEKLNQILEPFKELLSKIYDHWFFELVILLSFFVILFATQAALVPEDLLDGEFNIFIFFIVLGFSIYWFICSKLFGFFVYLTIFIKPLSEGKQPSFSNVDYMVTVIALLLGLSSLILSTICFYILKFFIEYRTWFHFGTFILSHLIILFSARKIITIVLKSVYKPGP